MADHQTTDRTVAPNTRIGAPDQPRIRRGVRLARTAFRSTRNLLAVLGAIFVYLLILGFVQYQDRAAAGDVACTFTHCL